jgi:hypothetical protein
MREADLFGAILAVQMLVIIALALHNRHIAALARDRASVIESLRQALAEAARPEHATAAPATARVDRRKAA